MIKSPCINVCKFNDKMICYGCFRHIDEIDIWDKLNDNEKLKILEISKNRKIKQVGDNYYGFP